MGTIKKVQNYKYHVSGDNRENQMDIVKPKGSHDDRY